MDKPESHPQPQQPVQATQPPKPATTAEPVAAKPNKDVSVPKYDLLTEGYDPAKLKVR